ncbi:molybdopterin-dependent oxidoreductase [Microbacterium sp. CFH 31415]|uniref:molybdopterin-dependent oxidoreductase n=1 Tax=Microbacterium sp. CFH 31415 TaxID=2921732 RepID=UPI001F136164|nr:molybdopterin-dependent oxidoreductase [Microbacterium sp. CFH 31415]MCH6231556.1 molybdopterin-dependent oxidoreductase [Microbacterium sp. CFH 31415]
MAKSRGERGIPSPLAWVAGVGAVALGAGLGDLLAALIAPSSGPFVAVGGTLIDLAPPWAKDTAIALFGTADKFALIVGIALVVLVLAALAGWLEARRPPWGRVVVLAFGVLGAVIAMTRPNAGALSWLPSTFAGVAGAVALWWLIRRLRPDDAPVTGPAPPGTQTAPSRRSFLAWSAGAAAAGLLAAVAASAMRATDAALTAIRAVVLPTPAAKAPAVPATAELGIPGLATVITPNDEFYRIDTALVVPRVDPAEWSLRIHGMVAEEVVLTWDELLRLPLEESYTTLACVSNEVGGSLIGNARWLGYPMRELLARARPTPGADMVLSRSIDGFTASTPLEALTDDRNALLAVGMNGEPLPPEHGFPVRMVVPGLYGYVSATKWITELTVTTFAADEAYWTPRGWSERGPIKVQSRIDVPRRAQGLKAGDTVIAGVAWQQGVGIEAVEVQIDDGDWRPAELATAISDDTWVQWSLPWRAEAGDHLIRCRATNREGEVQTSERAHPAPDGASGWHERFITVFE